MYERYYNHETKKYDMSFIQKYDYPLQFSIYAEILRQNYDKILEEFLKTYTEKEMSKFIELMNNDEYLECFILVVDKQEIPDRNIIFMDINSFIKEKLEEIELKLPRIMDIRNGVVEPEKCGHCDYCRSIKKIVKPIHYLDLLDGN
jgi:disulfide oxidoreductase YuzD